MKLKCGNCKIEIYKSPSHVRKKNFCSRECKAEWNKTLTGKKSSRWKGGVTKMNGGYLYKLIGDNRYEAVHRLVAEKKIGRKLREGEIIHHINENKLDNRPSNLEIVDRATHQRIHLPRKGTGKIKTTL